MTTYPKKVLKIIGQILMIGAVGSLIIFLLLQQMDKLTANLQDKKLLLETYNRHPQLIIKLKNDYQTITPYIDKIKNIISPRNETSNLIAKLEERAKNNKVSQKLQFINQFNIFSLWPRNKSFEIIAQGHPQNLTNYLKEIEDWPIFLNLENINISHDGEKSQLSLRGILH